VQRANEYSSQILIKKGDNQINAKSIMGILALGASYNSVLELIVEGEDEIQALEGLVALFNNRFEEE
jgi:phosphocarrier protein